MSARKSRTQRDPIQADTGPLAFVEWLSLHVNPTGSGSDAELSRAIKVSQSMLVRYRSNLTTPSFEVIRRACSELDLPVLAGLVKAGLLTESEAGLEVFEPNLREASSDDMLDELRERLKDC